MVVRPVTAASLFLASLSAGCVLLSPLYSMVTEETAGTGSANAVEYYAYEGQTRFGEHYRVRFLLEPQQQQRYTVISVDGKVYRAAREDIADDLAAAKAAYASAWLEPSEGAVRARFGAPRTTTSAGTVTVWWYPGDAHQMFALLFQSGRFVNAFRTTEDEFAALLAKPAPY